MTEAPYKDFLCEYPFEGATWSFVIKARSHAEAWSRLERMPWATVKGEIGAVIPATPGAGIFVRALCWFRNLTARAA
jgi:hypothetical protein